MAMPTNLPRWSDVGGGAGGAGGGAVPASTRLDTGWLYNERPTPRFFNWLFFTIYSWIVWLKAWVTAEREIWMDASMMETGAGGVAGTFAINTGTGVVAWTLGSGNAVAVATPGIRQGDRIKAFKIRADSTAGTLTGKLYRRTSTAAPTQIGSTLSHSATTTDQTHTLASPETVDAGDSFLLVIAGAAGGNSDLFAVCVVVDTLG